VGKSFNNEVMTEGEIENHILKINYYIKNKLNAYLKRIFDTTIVFMNEFWQKFSPVVTYKDATTYIASTYTKQPENLEY